MQDPLVERSFSTSRVVDMAEARMRLRPDDVRGDADFEAIANAEDEHRAIDPEDRVIYSLCDAVLMMFHLISERREPFACRDLRNAVRRAVNTEPMVETVEIRASTWTAISDIGFVTARLASRRRFDDVYCELE